MKKLLFVIHNTEIGGPQKSLLALLDNIDYSKFEAHVLVMQTQGILGKYFNTNVKFVKPSRMLTAMTLPSKNPLGSLFTFIKYGEIFLALQTIFSMIKYVFTNVNMNQERQRLWKKFHNRVPRIDGYYDAAFGILGLATYCVVDLVDAKNKFHWIRSDVRILKLNEAIEAEYFAKVDGFLSVSRICSQIFSSVYPFSEGRITTFYNYIPEKFYNSIPFDMNIMPLEPGVTRLISVTRLVSLKGIEMIIDVCEELLKNQENIKWYILGDGKERTKYENEISRRGLSGKLVLLGFQLNTLAFIESADIFLHLSESEGKSNAVDEAIYVGKPIIVTNYPTIKEQITDGITGVICNFSKGEIVNKIHKVIHDADLKKKLSTNCINSSHERENLSDLFNRLSSTPLPSS